MVAYKKTYTRMELTQTAPPGPQEWLCVLCHGLGYRLTDIRHADNCPLANAAVLGVDIVVRTAPRQDICGVCPGTCVVPDWRQESHEYLRTACGRYATEDI